MLKKLCFAVALLLAGANLQAAEPPIEKSQSVVSINGAKYYVHTVKAGETIYSLAKIYGVSEQVITKENPQLNEGLKTGQTIKIPLVESVVTNQTEKISPRKLKRTFDQHAVQAGETLYSISKRYSISVETIIEDNPGLDPVHLQIGSNLLIRKKAIGKTDERENTEAWYQYKDQLNQVASDGYLYHIVESGDTMYALARRFDTTVETLIELNGIQPSELRSGSMIKIPGRGRIASSVGSQPVQSDLVESIKTIPVKEIDFWALKTNEPLRIALLLPLSEDGGANPNYTDFYQGFLLGLEKIKNEYHYSVRVDLFDTQHNTARMEQIVADPDFKEARLIVGPVYEEELPAVLEYAEEHAIPIVSPLDDIEQTESDVLFQMAPPQSRKYAKIEELVDGEDKHVTLVYGEHNDKEFEHEIRATLGPNIHPEVMNYRFGDRSSERAINSLLTNGRDNVFIVLSNNSTEVDRILAAFSSANTNLVARGRTAPKFTIVGNSRWNRFRNLDRALFFKNRVVLFSTYHAKRDADIIKKFDSDYIKAFGLLPSLYSYRGYDAAMIFAPAMYSDIQYDMEGRNYTPLQTTYTFEQAPGRYNHTNQNWMRINYHPDFTITVD